MANKIARCNSSPPSDANLPWPSTSTQPPAHAYPTTVPPPLNRHTTLRHPPSKIVAQPTSRPPRRARSLLRLRECRAMTDEPVAHPSPPPCTHSTSHPPLVTHSTMPGHPPKRRATLNPTSPPLHPVHHNPLPPVVAISAKDVVLDTRARRRRLIVYVFAFGIMLALSSVLDVRRATLRNRNAKVQLTLPSASLSSLSDGLAVGTEAESGGSRDPVQVPLPVGGVAVAAGFPSAVAPSSSTTGASVPVAAPDKLAGDADVNLSDQELKDDVDQLLAHVAEEEGKGVDAAVPNATSAVQPPAAAAAKPVDEGGGVKSLASSILGVVGKSPGEDPPNSTVAAAETDVKLNSEEVFEGAQKRMQVLLGDESVRSFADENDLRTLQALALQATRGDCEQKSGGEQSLFKTDAEAASNVDIERTDPLWGAWCLFVGSYKTDAMRDYVIKQRVVEDKMMAAKAAAEVNMTIVGMITEFDPNAASLDDVLTPEQQSGLRSKMDTIASHLHESDVRYLAALSLQATFGDCGPYGKEKTEVVREGELAVELRKLREPLLDQTVVRREGAQWGAWCVLQGKKRTSAAAELSHRVDLLIDQLTKSQTAAAAETGGSEESLVADGVVVKAADAGGDGIEAET